MLHQGSAFYFVTEYAKDVVLSDLNVHIYTEKKTWQQGFFRMHSMLLGEKLCMGRF